MEAARKIAGGLPLRKGGEARPGEGGAAVGVGVDKDRPAPHDPPTCPPHAPPALPHRLGGGQDYFIEEEGGFGGHSPRCPVQTRHHSGVRLSGSARSRFSLAMMASM